MLRESRLVDQQLKMPKVIRMHLVTFGRNIAEARGLIWHQLTGQA